MSGLIAKWRRRGRRPERARARAYRVGNQVDRELLVTTKRVEAAVRVARRRLDLLHQLAHALENCRERARERGIVQVGEEGGVRARAREGHADCGARARAAELDGPSRGERGLRDGDCDEHKSHALHQKAC